jgi:hypothetical protein
MVAPSGALRGRILISYDHCKEIVSITGFSFQALCIVNIPGALDNIRHNICVMQQSLSQIFSESQSL